MIKKTTLLIFLVCCITNGFSQKTPSDYSYVIVPEIYGFLHHEDQFQLNSLTKFLLNKYGFNAYFPSELPNVKRCDGLQAEVVSNSNFIYTKLVVVLKDCYGTEVFRSEEGRSKYKDYRKSYHQAIREAFESIEALQVRQKEVVSYADLDGNEINPEGVEVNPQLVGDVVNDSEKTTTTGTKVGGPANLNLPEAKYSSYISNGVSYLLRKTDDGYALYEESTAALDGLVLMGKVTLVGNSVVYIAEDGTRYAGIFSENHDFSIISEGKVQNFKAVN